MNEPSSESRVEGHSPIRIQGTVVAGHGVAGGSSPTSPYGTGTIEQQIPYFLDRGLDLRNCHPATLNVDTGSNVLRFVAPSFRFDNVRWTELHGPETFEFVRVILETGDARVKAWGYRPLPETKPGQHQPANILEVLAPFLEGIGAGSRLTLELNPAEVMVERDWRPKNQETLKVTGRVPPH